MTTRQSRRHSIIQSRGRRQTARPHRKDIQRQGRLVPRGQGRLARQTDSESRPRQGPRGAGDTPVAGAKPVVRIRDRGPKPPRSQRRTHHALTQAGRHSRDARSLRRCAGEARHGGRSNHCPRWRHQELHVFREGAEGKTGAVPGNVHRRTEHGGGGDGSCRSRQRFRLSRRSRRFSRARTTRSAWREFRDRISKSAVRIAASRLEKTGRRRWDWKTSQCSARFQTASCCIRPMRCPPSAWWLKPQDVTGSATSGQRGPRLRCYIPMKSSSRSVDRRRCASRQRIG